MYNSVLLVMCESWFCIVNEVMNEWLPCNTLLNQCHVIFMLSRTVPEEKLNISLKVVAILSICWCYRRRITRITHSVKHMIYTSLKGVVHVYDKYNFKYNP